MAKDRRKDLTDLSRVVSLMFFVRILSFSNFLMAGQINEILHGINKKLIVYPFRRDLRITGAVIILGTIWTLATILALPMFIFKRLVSYDIPFANIEHMRIAYCIEDWPIENGRALYSTLSFCFQYFIPIATVSFAHLRVYCKLKSHVAFSSPAGKVAMVNFTENDKRFKNTNLILVSVAIIFALSWLPLNFFNLYADFCLTKKIMSDKVMFVYAVCHMFGMSSACSNPLLYGWLNEKFRQEFRTLFCRKPPSSQYSHSHNSLFMENRQLIKISTKNDTDVDVEISNEPELFVKQPAIGKDCEVYN